MHPRRRLTKPGDVNSALPGTAKSERHGSYLSSCLDRESRDTGNEVLAEASLTQVSGSDIVRGRLCQYLREWTALKIRWSLTVDRAEKRALLRRAAGCRNVVVTVRKAKVRTRA